jgi:hypothetical protein
MWRQKTTLLHDGFRRMCFAPLLEHIFGDSCSVDAVELIYSWALLFLNLSKKKLIRAIRAWLREMAHNIDPFLVPTEYARADFVPG